VCRPFTNEEVFVLKPIEGYEDGSGGAQENGNLMNPGLIVAQRRVRNQVGLVVVVNREHTVN
jgi:hypothetical protein